MSTDLAVRNVELSNDQLQFIASTEFVPPGLRGNLPAILACVATGRSLGLPDMTALRSIHIIDGKATFSAELMVMLVRRAGHSIVGEVADGTATAIGTRADNGDTMTVRWTRDMADRAGLLSKRNWKQYEESMLWARAVSQLCRMLFADAFGGGATYTPEELEDTAGEDAAIPDGNAAAQSLGESPAPPAVPATAPQKRKLDVLVKGGGPLAPPLPRVYATVAKMRDLTAADLIAQLDAYAEDGRLRWSPLRDSLSKAEAHELIERLEALESAA